MTLKPARSYVRVSTLKDSQKDSPEHQDGAIREHASPLGFHIEHVYEDRDTGTSIISRDEVQRLIDEGKRGEYNTLFFSSLSRFSRDALDALSLKRVLVNALGIRVISIEDFYDSGVDDNELLFGVVSVVNQKLSEQISVSSKRGIRQSALKGNFIGSIPPYGYKKATVDERKTLIVDNQQAGVVRLIYDLYVNHKMGEKAIVDFLNGDGGTREQIPSYKGGLWGLTSVQRVLTNEVYTGVNVIGKNEITKVYNDINNMHDRERKQVQKKTSSWERTSFKTHEAIIEDDLFQKAQDIRLVRGGGQRGGKKTYVNVFAKFIFCDHCGSAMVTMAGKKKDTYRYLMCSKRRRQGAIGCENDKWIPYYDFRDDVIKWVIESMTSRIDSESRADVAAKNAKITEVNFEKERRRISKNIDDGRKLLFELRRRNMLGEIDDNQYEYERKIYEEEIRTFEEKLKAIEKKAGESNDRAKLRKAVLENLNELKSLEDYGNVDSTRIILSRLIEQIKVDKEGNIDIYSPLGKLG